MRKAGELKKYRYLHFATHGEGNNVKAFESALILAQDKLPKELVSKPGEPYINGQLSAREVLDYWKLNADLVTLSACETAIGKGGIGVPGRLGRVTGAMTVIIPAVAPAAYCPGWRSETFSRNSLAAAGSG
jgi:CHAT domain-containing protein